MEARELFAWVGDLKPTILLIVPPDFNFPNSLTGVSHWHSATKATFKPLLYKDRLPAAFQLRHILESPTHLPYLGEEINFSSEFITSALVK
jgi:hypothetical protein